MKISVIVPFYKDVKYIQECLNSLSAQTMTDFEVLLVDDCGNDGSYEIAKEWYEDGLDNRNYKVDLMRNQENSGSSTSRNNALERASGKYVMFLDADDYLKKDALEKIVSRMEEQKLDDLYFNAHSFYESLTAHRLVRENYDNRSSFEGVYSGKELFAKMVNCGELFPQGALRAYRADFLRQNNLRFKENNIHEDLLLLVQAIVLSNRTSFLNEQIYMRRVHCNSKMVNRNRTIKNVSGHFETLFWFKQWMDGNSKNCNSEFLKAYEIFMEKYGRLCARDIGWFITNDELNLYADSLNTLEREAFESLIIKPYLKDYEKNPNTALSHKLLRYSMLPFRGAREVFNYIKERR